MNLYYVIDHHKVESETVLYLNRIGFNRSQDLEEDEEKPLGFFGPDPTTRI
jgi:hypothetical protein